MRGGGSPLNPSGGGIGITGSPSAGWTALATAIDTPDTAETILTLGVAGTPSGDRLILLNDTTSDGAFVPKIRFTRITDSGTIGKIDWLGTGGGLDSGTAPVGIFNVTNFGSTAWATRPLYSFRNNNVSILDMLPLNSGANMAMSWGTQGSGAPTLTNRSIGTRIITYSTLGASDVDCAIGAAGSGGTQWYSVPRATSTYNHTFYAGTSVALNIRGDGLFTTIGGQVSKVRVALTTPATVVAGTDFHIVTKLTTPGAVAVNLPAGVAGQEFVVQDGTGDAAANNITITPAAGTINGAATLVIAANYGRTTLRYDGTLWLAG